MTPLNRGTASPGLDEDRQVDCVSGEKSNGSGGKNFTPSTGRTGKKFDRNGEKNLTGSGKKI